MARKQSKKQQVFEGIKVADFSWVGTGPVTVKYLADHGAFVIKIESATHVELGRAAPPMKESIHGVNRGGWFNEFNRNKYGITLNLNHPRAIDVVRRIVAWADIVAENLTPGTMDRLGFGYKDMVRIKPDIIMFSTSMHGLTGPYHTHPGYGVLLTGSAGMTHLTGWPDRGPVEVYGAYTDWLVPPIGAAAISAALDYRRRTGKGQHIDVSQYEVAVNFLAPVVLDYVVNGRIANRDGNCCPYAAPHGVYRCRGTDRWCAITVFTDEEWQAFCDVIGDKSLINNPKFATLGKRKQNEEELNRLTEQWTKTHTAGEVMGLMQAAGVAAGVVASGQDTMNDPQLKARHFWHLLEHPEIGKYTVRGTCFNLSKTPARIDRAAPCLSEHNEYIYTKVLGMPDDEFVELLADGVFD